MSTLALLPAKNCWLSSGVWRMPIISIIIWISWKFGFQFSRLLNKIWFLPNSAFYWTLRWYNFSWKKHFGAWFGYSLGISIFTWYLWPAKGPGGASTKTVICWMYLKFSVSISSRNFKWSTLSSEKDEQCLHHPWLPHAKFPSLLQASVP